MKIIRMGDTDRTVSSLGVTIETHMSSGGRFFYAIIYVNGVYRDETSLANTESAAIVAAKVSRAACGF